MKEIIELLGQLNASSKKLWNGCTDLYWLLRISVLKYAACRRKTKIYDLAKELHWFEPWQTTFEWTNKPFFKWFVGGKCNIVFNCLDRHMQTTTRSKVAFYWEGDDGSTRTITYRELYIMTNRLAKGLQQLGVEKGDRVAIYLSTTPEQIAAVLAVARLGAIHTVVFGGFAASAFRDRIID